VALVLGSQAFLLLAAFLTWRALGRGPAAACSVACVWALTGRPRRTLSGTTGTAIGAVAGSGVLARGGDAGRGSGGGLLLKLLPGVLAIVPLLRRDWRAVAALITVTIVLVLVPAAVIAHWKTGPAFPGHADYWMGRRAAELVAPGDCAARGRSARLAARVPVNWESAIYPRLSSAAGPTWLSARHWRRAAAGGLAALLAVSAANSTRLRRHGPRGVDLAQRGRRRRFVEPLTRSCNTPDWPCCCAAR